MSQQKKILMLGGSAQQVPAIKKAKEMGYATVLIDYLPDNPGQHVADQWYQESTTDIEKVYQIAKEEKVDGILAYASDPAALPAAIVAERLGLPTNPAESVRILGMKHEFRKFLHENNFPAPKIFTFSPDDPIEKIKIGVSQLSLPIVIKPTDSSGSKGVTFLEDLYLLDKAIAFADSYSRNKIIIAEEFIQRGFPDVIGGDIFVADGKIILFGDMAALRGPDGKSLIPVGEKWPNNLNPSQRRTVYQELQKIVDLLKIKNGQLNIELLIDKNGYPQFLELGPRAGGNMIPIQLSDIFDVDLIEANIKAAMGEKIDFLPKSHEGAFMTYVLHSFVTGIFESIEISPELEPFIYRKVIYKNPGDEVEFFDGAGKALGILFMKFPDKEIMEKNLINISNLININLN